jgi:hypothetical protein
MAVEKFEKETGEKASEATDIDLQLQIPAMEKMDSEPLEKLVKCEKLCLATNCFEKLNFPTMANLKILSIGRNKIKTFAGLVSAKVCHMLKSLMLLSYRSHSVIHSRNYGSATIRLKKSTASKR